MITEFSPSTIDSAQLDRLKVMPVRYSADDALGTVFYKRKIIAPYKSRKEGVVVYEERDYIRMTIPNNGARPLNEVDREATPEDRQRFPREWALYEADEDQVGRGLRIRDCVAFDREECEMLENARIRTVQQLAAVADRIVGDLFNGRELQERARKWLHNLDAVQNHEKTTSEITELRSQLSQVLEQNAKLMHMMQNGNTVAEPKKRGRKPKSQTVPAAPDAPQEAA